MKLHDRDGTPYEPESAVNLFQARFLPAGVLAEIVAEMHPDLASDGVVAKALAEAVLALRDDLAQLSEMVADWQVSHDHTPRVRRS